MHKTNCMQSIGHISTWEVFSSINWDTIRRLHITNVLFECTSAEVSAEVHIQQRQPGPKMHG